MSLLEKLEKTSNSVFEKIQMAITEPANAKKSNPNEWKLTVNDNKEGSAVIRFLPSLEDGKFPWIEVMSYYFYGENKKLYNETSLRTFGQIDPVAKYCAEQWQILNEEERKKLPRVNRSWYSNILVIKDPANPENEGKVFRFRFGRTIFNKIESAFKPAMEDDPTFNPFDIFNGADLRLISKNKAGWQNYDNTSWSQIKPIYDGDKDKIEAVLEQIMKLPNLHELNDPSNAKPYEQLEAKLNEVLELNKTKRQLRTEESQDVWVTPAEHEPVEVKNPLETQQPSNTSGEYGDSDDFEKFFNSL